MDLYLLIMSCDKKEFKNKKHSNFFHSFNSLFNSLACFSTTDFLFKLYIFCHNMIIVNIRHISVFLSLLPLQQWTTYIFFHHQQPLFHTVEMPSICCLDHLYQLFDNLLVRRRGSSGMDRGDWDWLGEKRWCVGLKGGCLNNRWRLVIALRMWFLLGFWFLSS